jgi:hypothetical protein
MCLSNSGGDQILQTLCFNVAADNSVDGDPWCVVTVGPPVVSDGCYPEKFNTNATTANTPTYSSTVHPPTNQINLASAIVAPFVMAVFSVILSMSIGM